MGVARADEKADADALVREGAALAQAGKLGDAITRFKAAEAKLPRVLHLCNIGVAYAKLGRPDRAQLFFQRCRMGSKAAEWKTIAKTADDVDRALARGGFGELTLEIDPGDAKVSVSTLDDDEAFRARDVNHLWAPLGQVTVIATKDGLAPQKLTVRAEAGKPATIKLILTASTPEPEPEPAPEPAPEPEPTPTPTPASRLPPPDSASRAPSSRRTWSYVTLAAGGALLGTGLWAHTSALDRKSDAETFAPGPEFDDANSAYESRRTLAYGLYAGGAIVAGLGTYLFFTSGTSATATPSDGGATVWLTGRFE